MAKQNGSAWAGARRRVRMESDAGERVVIAPEILANVRIFGPVPADPDGMARPGSVPGAERLDHGPVPLRIPEQRVGQGLHQAVSVGELFEAARQDSARALQPVEPDRPAFVIHRFRDVFWQETAGCTESACHLRPWQPQRVRNGQDRMAAQSCQDLGIRGGACLLAAQGQPRRDGMGRVAFVGDDQGGAVRILRMGGVRYRNTISIPVREGGQGRIFLLAPDRVRTLEEQEAAARPANVVADLGLVP